MLPRRDITPIKIVYLNLNILSFFLSFFQYMYL